jgi:Zn-dependent M28 family amino/carboxypeptidase
VGIVPAESGSGDENIIVNAHADGWFDAAGDNADGLAVLLAMARHFSRPEHRPNRTLVFVVSGGHHSPGLNGPSNVVSKNGALTSGTLLVLNLEHVAQFEINSRTWTADPDEEPMSFGISNEVPLLVDLGKRGVERYGFRLDPVFSASVPGDLGGYASLGVPRVQAIHAGPMYHTSGDVAETISVPGLERAARFFTFFVTEVARAKEGDLRPRGR